MAQVRTNECSLQYAIETSLGVAGTSWRRLEPNEIGSFGATISTTPRRPISKQRGRRKGLITNLESAPEFSADLTMSSIEDFLEGFMFSEFANVEFDLTHAKANGAALSTTATGYDLAAAATVGSLTNGTEIAAKTVYNATGAITLIYARGYLLAANNGLKPLNADVTGASTEITVSGLSVETAPANAKVWIAGVRTDDLTLTISGSTATLASAADIPNWATLGLRAGMYIHIGSGTSLGAVQNAYSTNTVFGYARITSVSGTTLNLDKLDSHLTGGPYGPATIDVLFGRFARNLEVDDNDNDERYLSRSYQLEMEWPNLGGAGLNEYEYAIGNQANELSMELAMEDKAVGTWGFVGQDTETPVVAASRKVGADSALAPLLVAGFGTMTSIASITTNVVSSVSDVCFKDITLAIRNNASPEGCLGHLGAEYINIGAFEIGLEGQMLFTRKEIVEAVRNNTTVTWALILYNEDGSAAFDVPSMTFGDGSRELPIDESVLVNITGESFTDATFGYDMGVSLFVGTPTARD